MNITEASLFPGLDGFARSLGLQYEFAMDQNVRDMEGLL